MSNYFWETDRIRLRQVEPDDWVVFQQWDLDSEMLRNYGEIPFPKGSGRYKFEIQNEANAAPVDDRFMLMIEEIDSKSIAGAIISHTTNRRVGAFSYGVVIRAEYRRKGYAKDAILLLLKYFFEELRYQKCTVALHGWNTATVGLHERIGFIKEGQHRRVLFTHGRHWDMLFYGITDEEWREKYA
jgi:RimJ/RimL family protein N-acetyltransferase